MLLYIAILLTARVSPLGLRTLQILVTYTITIRSLTWYQIRLTLLHSFCLCKGLRVSMSHCLGLICEGIHIALVKLSHIMHTSSSIVNVNIDDCACVLGFGFRVPEVWGLIWVKNNGSSIFKLIFYVDCTFEILSMFVFFVMVSWTQEILRDSSGHIEDLFALTLGLGLSFSWIADFKIKGLLSFIGSWIDIFIPFHLLRRGIGQKWLFQ